LWQPAVVVSVISSFITSEILLFPWFILQPFQHYTPESDCKVTDELQSGKYLEGVVTAYYDA
jgi:hypothetical protein